MPHKYTVQSELTKLETDIAYYDRSISKVKSIKRGDKDSIKHALEILKDLKDTLETAVDNCLGNPNHVRSLRAISWAGEKRGIAKAIRVFEDPESQLSYYRQQKGIAEAELKRLKAMSLRTEE